MNIILSKKDAPAKQTKCSLKKVCAQLCLMTIIFSFTMIASCNTYDEEDVTIIGILKINDLIEKKLMPVCDAEVEKLNKAIEEYNESIDMYNFSNLFNLGLSNGIKELDYDVDQINLMAEKYNTSDNNFDLNKLEIDLTTELWTYFNLTYSDIIPAKAQNTQEGRYFTITELKEKYPDYTNLEITDFRPMELISTIDNEKLFDISILTEGDINLRTLYIFYLHKRKELEEFEKAVDTFKNTYNIDYMSIIKEHCNEESLKEVDTNGIMNIFHELCTQDNPAYEYNEKGFRKFAFDYFETDMFRGEDID